MAEIRINAEQWNSVSSTEQQKILEGLRGTGALGPEDVIVADAAAPAFTEDTVMQPMWNPIKDLCKAACDTAAGMAVAWCTANTGGIGLAACLAAAEVARTHCRGRC